MIMRQISLFLKMKAMFLEGIEGLLPWLALKSPSDCLLEGKALHVF